MPIAEAPVVVGRSGAATLRLLHPTISRRHATLARAGGGFALEDHDSRFGTFVNGARVRTTTLRPDDRVQFGSAIPYRVQSDGLRLDVAARGLSLQAYGLTVSVAAERSRDPGRWFDGLRRPGPTRGEADRLGHRHKCLVRGVGFHVRPDTFVGILGPSGAGKSTILNVLASGLVPGRGRVVFDGRHDLHADLDVYRAMLGHVPQDDVVYRSLSVRENLAFAARLRLGAEARPREVDAAIGRALEQVDLVEHAGEPVAVLSGGQRKRLSVAIELLRRPRLLLLDEPTSGLDPAGEARLMEGLRHLARRGTTVVCTTHLMDNLRLLDEVIVLGTIDGTGRVAYDGPPADLLSHFRCRGYADLYELLDSGRFEPVASPGDEPSDPVPVESRGPSAVPGTGPVLVLPDTGSEPSARRPEIGRWAATVASNPARSQLPLVARRSLKLVLRDRGLAWAMLAQPLVLGLLVVVTQYDVDGALPLLFFAVVVAIWLGLNNSARDLVRERRHYVRDRLAGLRPGAYLGAKAAVHAALGAVQLLVLMAVLRVGCGWALQFPSAAQELAAISAVRLFPTLMAGYLGGVGLGLLVSTLVRTEEAAVAALPLLIMPQLLLSVVATGMQGRRYDEPRPFRPLVVTLRGGQSMPRPAVVVDVLSMACLSRPAVLVAESPGVPGYGPWTPLGDVCHLLILLLATWTALLLAFGWAERRWLRRIGL